MRDMNLVTHILCLTISQKSDHSRQESFFFPREIIYFRKNGTKAKGVPIIGRKLVGDFKSFKSLETPP